MGWRSTCGILEVMADAKPKVLLVEDDPFMVTLLSQEFSREGFEVSFADNGEDAPKRFQSTNPDVLVIDILLPKKNGLEALAEIRTLPGGEKVPVVILSNLEESNYIADAEKLGVKAYLIKANVQLSEIVAKVKEIIKKK